MNHRNETPELTPAQIDFCGRHIEHFDPHTWQVSVAGKAGSDRRFLRISPVDGKGVSRILVLWDSHDKDWERFLKINKEVSRSLPLLPEIYATDEKHGLILEEDCGQHTLKDFCSRVTDSETIEGMYRQVLDVLIQWQDIAKEQTPVIASRVLDKEMLIWETDYFAAHCVSEYFGLDSLLTAEWEQERNRLAEDVAALPLVCLHRDFQSENIMIHNGKIKFVDFQGARLGAAEYDVASLFFDPYVSMLNDEMRYLLLDYYIKHSSSSITEHSFYIAALQRLSQALGAYGNLSLHKGKEYYKDYIPCALLLLLNVLEKESNYPYFRKIVQECRNRV